jgi:HEAT repeat protein
VAAATLLINLLATSERSDLRQEAVSALKAIGPSAPGAVEAVRSALNDPDPDVRSVAEEAFSAMAARPH